MEQTEADLESFREQWRAEVRKQKQRPTNHDRNSQSAAGPSRRHDTRPPTSTYRPPDHGWEDVEPRSYHDLDERHGGGRRLDETEEEAARHREPESALEHYEKAVERESQGSLGDSVRLYRTAFKLDQNVHEQYKDKHFAEAWKKGSKGRPLPKAVDPHLSNASVSGPSQEKQALQALPQSVSSLISDFSQLAIHGEEPPTELSPPPPCPIASIPEELLIDILLYTALRDLASFSRLALVCKRLAYLVLTEDRIWKRIACGDEYGFAAMRYRYACTISGNPLFSKSAWDDEITNLGDDELDLLTSPTTTVPLPLSTQYPSYRHLFKHRPRIRFNGCYISTVNYPRPGGPSSGQSHNTWSSPVLIVTYYRYLRFFRDGSVVSLLTVAEPQDVVHHLTKENVHKKDYPSGLPGACMKDALRGRWRLSGPDATFAPAQGLNADGEAEGDLHIETEGVVSRYDYCMHLGFGSAGRGAKNNKLAWKGYWSYNKLTDDWSEFGMRNYRAYYWSRVKSYGNGL